MKLTVSLLTAALTAAVFLAPLATPFAAQAGETKLYKDGDVELEGYWAPSACDREDDKGPAPLVLVIHQWRGITDHEKSRADRLAAECYNAFAIDMYGKGIRPANNDDAGREATKYKSDPALARRRIKAGLDFAKTLPGVDASKIASMGFCFGGTMSLELARSGADIDGVISFHGGLSTPAPAKAPGDIKAAVQVHHGAADPLVPPEEVKAFTGEMNAADADWAMTSYAHAVHSFTQKEAGNDPSTGVAYNEKADRRSWEAATDFLEEIFGE